MHLFPIEINTAPPETLVRVPGIGFRSANKIVSARRYGKLSFDDLKKMRVVLKRAAHFITVDGKFYGYENLQSVSNVLALTEQNDNIEQLSLFSTNETALSAISGEI